MTTPHHHFDYHRAKAMWAAKGVRTYKNLGRNVDDGTYCRPNPDGSDSYEVGYTKERYRMVEIVDAQGQKRNGYQRIPLRERKFTAVATLYPDRTYVFSNFSPLIIDRVFRFRILSGDRRKTTGWRFVVEEEIPPDQRKSNHAWYSTKWVTRAVGGMPLTIWADGRFVPGQQAKFRKVDDDLNLELKRLVRTVRNIFRTRAKLGVLDGIPVDVLDKSMARVDMREGQSAFNAAGFLQVLRFVDENDFTSLYPLLRVCIASTMLPDKMRGYRRPDGTQFSGASIFDQYMYRFERTLEKNREGIKKLHGAVTFEYDEAAAEELKAA